MAVSNGGDGDKTAHGVITAAPGTAHFEGVWLIGEAWGRQAASPNVGLTLDSAGLTVTGPAPGQKSTIPWTWVQNFSAGNPMTFPDGASATVVEVGLIGRSITLLVPPTQLRQDEIGELNRYVPARLPPPPPPPPQPLEEIRQDPAYSAERSVGVSAEALSAEVDTANRPKDSRGRSARVDDRSLRLAVLLAMLVLVALVGTVVIAVRIHNNDQSSNPALIIPQATTSTLPPAPSTLSGPATSANSEAVSRLVNLNLHELPAGWGKLTSAVPKSPLPSVFADAKKNADKSLASCLRLPLSQIGMVTGETEPGGPTVWPSPIFVRSSQFNPSAISVSTLVANAATERSNLAALLRPGTAHCFDVYYETSFAADHIITAPLVFQFRVPQHAGEEVIGLDVHVGISLNGHPAVFDYDLVVIGAGRLEVAVGAQQDNEPFSESVLNPAVRAIEAKAASVAGGH